MDAPELASLPPTALIARAEQYYGQMGQELERYHATNSKMYFAGAVPYAQEIIKAVNELRRRGEAVPEIVAGMEDVAQDVVRNDPTRPEAVAANLISSCFSRALSLLLALGVVTVTCLMLWC